MSELAERLFETIRKKELLHPGDRVAAAVSGGADSVALLCLLDDYRAELGIVLCVAHVNHKLRGAESDEDMRFVAALAAARGLEFHSVDARIDSAAQGSSRGAVNLEARARELRYQFFRELARQGHATKIATAHTLDDQAETLLLRVFRGTGIRGLAAIHPRIRLEEQGEKFGEAVRPLLGVRRTELREYLRARGQTWREDSSNRDVRFLRNRLRQRLLPLIIEEFGEAAVEHMRELAEIARAEEEWIVTTPPVSGFHGDRESLDAEQLLGLPLAVARRRLRAWIESSAPEASISFRLIEEILELARGPAGKELELPRGATVVRRGRKDLVLERKGECEAPDYEYVLPVPGEVVVPELKARIVARIVDVESIPENDRDNLLDPDIGKKIVIRNWRPGDRFWPAHTAAEAKVKTLLSDRHATGEQKKLWPVAVTEDGALVWMRGFAVPAALNVRTSNAQKGTAVWIREIAAS